MEHPRIYAGVDTHSDTHTLALIDEYGRPLATQTFMADPTGYERLAAMIGDPDACLGVGVEGTNSYGAAPARRLVEAGYDVHEALRPKRSVRRRDGKSDPVDALAAARSVLAGDGTSVPKSADGWVEALRAPDAERAQLVTATAALSDSAKGLPATAPEHIRERYRGLRTPIRMRRLAVCRPSGNMVEQGMLVALKAAGKAWKALKEQADLLERSMRLILEEHARPLLDIYCASTVTAATLAIVAGDNPERIRSEAASDQALRRLSHPRLQRQDQPAPAQQRRQQAGQLRPAPHRHRPHALPPAHPRLRESEDRGRQRQDGDHPLPETLYRSRGLPGPRLHPPGTDAPEQATGRTRTTASRATRRARHHPATDRRRPRRPLQPHQRDRTRHPQPTRTRTTRRTLDPNHHHPEPTNPTHRNL